jgi:hypothetical protein
VELSRFSQEIPAGHPMATGKASPCGKLYKERLT